MSQFVHFLMVVGGLVIIIIIIMSGLVSRIILALVSVAGGDWVRGKRCGTSISFCDIFYL